MSLKFREFLGEKPTQRGQKRLKFPVIREKQGIPAETGSLKTGSTATRPAVSGQYSISARHGPKTREPVA
jgi:hypothetical protein